MSKPSVIAMIPARAGSSRLKLKNLCLLDGKPVIMHAIDAAKNAGIFDQIVVNSDHPAFAKISNRSGVDFYHRPESLGSSDARSDEVVADFMGHYPADVLVWVNPIAPLQPAAEIHDAVTYFISGGYDSLITVKNEQVHCVFQSRPVNFDPNGLFDKTQDLTPVQSFVYSLMMWRRETFMSHYREKGYALLSGKLGFYPISRESSVIIKYGEDLKIAEALLKARHSDNEDILYDPLAEEILGSL